ncbi:MAG: hypothetical protein H7A53_11920 [Akkermansiaceae bacterium]|nr:hypothetical protein [Akkermansiaceae bacterium]
MARFWRAGAVCRLADATRRRIITTTSTPAESFHEVATPCFGHEMRRLATVNAPLPCGQDLDRDASFPARRVVFFPPKLPDFPSEWNSM